METQNNESDQTQPAIYITSAVLGIIDNDNFLFTFTSTETVPVYNESKELLGFANIFVKNNKLIADLSIDYSTPERFEIDSKNQSFYARIRGSYNIEPGLYADQSETIVDIPGHNVKFNLHVSIFEIILANNRPRDHRIDPVGTPIL